MYIKRKRKRSDSVLWQNPLYQQKCQKGKVTTQTTPQKSSITQRLRTDLGRHNILCRCIYNDKEVIINILQHPFSVLNSVEYLLSREQILYRYKNTSVGRRKDLEAIRLPKFCYKSFNAKSWRSEFNNNFIWLNIAKK